MSTILVWKNWY